MCDFLKKSAAYAVTIFSFVLTVVPEDVFKSISLCKNWSDTVVILVNRLLLILGIWLVTMMIYKIIISIKWWKIIDGNNYTIVVKYKDIFKMKNCKKVIPFDECFTATVGNAPGDINAASICGQYLSKYFREDMQQLISEIQLKPKGKSKYQGLDRYEPGVLIPNQEYLLMAFAKLDKNGSGRLTRDEYVECLAVLWKEIDKYYGQQDICIPILGSGVTRMEDSALKQQQLLDIIIASYKLSADKIKKPNKLYIVCRKSDDFSLSKIGEYV